MRFSFVLVLAGCGFSAAPTEAEGPFWFQGAEYESQQVWGETHRKCGNELEPGQADAIDAWLVDRGVIPDPNAPVHAAPPPLQTGGVINVYWHVIYGNNGNANLTQQQVDDQIATLNAAYATTGWSFVLAGTDWTQDQQWATMSMGSNDEIDAKAALRQGTADDLNLYSADLPNGLLGWSSFPWEYAADPTYDGVVVYYDTLPGGGAFPFDEGDTTVHEVGHWLGLFHTFERGCSAKGDKVADTPAEGSAAYGCPVNRNTCAGGGKDPITNYMDYTDDACMYELSAGQDARIDLMFTNLRYLQ